MKKGSFVISLDFELFWGVIDATTKEKFGQQILGARKAIPQILDLFNEYDIHATWGIVGLLFAENHSELIEYSPQVKPNYIEKKFSAYDYFDCVGENEQDDVFHFAPSLIQKIKQYNHQEIASHTYSHYYCKALGQDETSFEHDLTSAQNIANAKQNVVLKSLILPRNQYLKEYAKVIKKCGFSSVRGNPAHYAYNNSDMFARAMRLLDSYTNICGMKCYGVKDCVEDEIINIKASCFFRKYNKNLKLLEGLKIYSIKRQMKFAAKKGKIFHLWWHPHNFGTNTQINLNQMRLIFEYYKELNAKYGFESKNMRETANEIIQKYNKNSLNSAL